MKKNNLLVGALMTLVSACVIAESTHVPDCVGKALESCEVILKDAHLRLGKVKIIASNQLKDPTAEPGNVYGMIPKAGTTIELGKYVHLKVVEKATIEKTQPLPDMQAIAENCFGETLHQCSSYLNAYFEKGFCNPWETIGIPDYKSKYPYGKVSNVEKARGGNCYKIHIAREFVPSNFCTGLTPEACLALLHNEENSLRFGKVEFAKEIIEYSENIEEGKIIVTSDKRMCRYDTTNPLNNCIYVKISGRP
ncbi:MAG: hypothetical protein H6968_07270 [Chromatiaceae bacterium]|nr:hypothetical protein [Chromatiaceae bacterium]